MDKAPFYTVGYTSDTYTPQELHTLSTGPAISEITLPVDPYDDELTACHMVYTAGVILHGAPHGKR